MTQIAQATVNDLGFWDLENKVDKLNRRAKRLGMDPIVVLVTGFHWVHETHPKTGLVSSTRMRDVVVEGSIPVVEGWTVQARVEFTPAGNLIITAPGVDHVDPKYRTADPHCDHCQKLRRRKDCVVIRHSETGEERMVGRNCLADFIREGDVARLAAWAEMMQEFANLTSCDADPEDFYSGGRRIPETCQAIEVLSAAAVCIRRLGWTSAKAAYENEGLSPTRGDVSSLLWPWFPSEEARREWNRWVDKHELHICPADTELAEEALQWMREIPQDATSDFLNNLRVLAHLEEIPRDKLGILCAAIPSMQAAKEREINRRRRAAEEAAKGEKVHVGRIKERLRGLEVEVVGQRFLESDWGSTTMIRFEQLDPAAKERVVLVWFASGDRGDIELGDRLVIDATVKKHETHEQYGKSTHVNRVTVKKELAAS